MRIAIADDQVEDLESLASTLKEAGYACTCMNNGDDVIAALRRETFDLLLLDWNMPRSSGLDVVLWANENLPNPPPIMLLTSRDNKDDVIRALDSGAMDYIVKPGDPDIIRARISAALRRRGLDAGSDTATLAGYTFDRARQAVTFAGETIQLRAKEFELARLLFENINRPLSRSYIMARVWNASPDMETRTLDMHVSRIRAKLVLRPERGVALRTVFGFGYRLDSCENQAEAG